MAVLPGGADCGARMSISSKVFPSHWWNPVQVAAPGARSAGRRWLVAHHHVGAGAGVRFSYVSLLLTAANSRKVVASAMRTKVVRCLESSTSELRQGSSMHRSTGLLSDVKWEAIARRFELVCESSPETSLMKGRWVKLICGASFEDIADVRNLSLIYTLAGVDCIDCAADAAIVAAVIEGINAAKDVLQSIRSGIVGSFRKPWVMISINDDEDPHFRKAEFSSDHCPVNCPRPCERVCPASAIKFQDSNKEAPSNHLEGGVIVDRCYGCGRCLPVCPLGLISAISYVRPLKTMANLMRSEDVDAVEIHTGAGHLSSFRDLVSQLGSALTTLKLVAVSVPDLEEFMIPSLTAMYTSMQPFVQNLNLWQLDGRPMSGDIGIGATRAAITLAQKVTSSQDRPPGFIQLAGGTNAHTATALKNVGMHGCMTYQRHGESLKYGDNQSSRAVIAGVAYGGYARKIVNKFLRQLNEEGTRKDGVLKPTSSLHLEHCPSLLLDAVLEANALVDGIKRGIN